MAKQWFKITVVNLLVLIILLLGVLFLLNIYLIKNNPRRLDILYYKDGSENLRPVLKPNTVATQGCITYKINSLGFRDNEYPFTKSKGYYRILCVGDSLTFGMGVKLEDIYAKVLEKKLQNRYTRCIEVINTGICGYNTYDEYWYIKDKLLKLNPDMIIVGFFIGNDPEDPDFEFNKAITQHNEPCKEVSLVAYIKRKIENNKLLKENYWERYISLMWYADGSQWKRCVKALGDIKQITEKNNIKLLVFIIPNLEERPDKRLMFHRQLIDTLKQLDIWHIDALPTLIKKETLFLPNSKEDNHPNAKMHKIYAEVLFTELEKNRCMTHVKENEN